MLIKRPDDIRSSEITPEDAFMNRRRFLGATGLLGVGAAIGLSACGPKDTGASDSTQRALDTTPVAPPARSEITAYDDATGYNNYYEFGTDKEDPKTHAGGLRTQPWTVEVEGLVKKPTRYAIDDLFKGMTASERVYRHRCVEAWSMVIPWLGYPLRDVLARLEPLPSAKFVEFTTLSDPQQMPGQRINVLQWPYTEALRMDEAMHPLALLATGMYGKPAPNQNGAPLRLIVPWKYGFKGAKAIVRIRFLDKQPETTWNLSAPNEYGFYANVNPTVDHPRWSQAKERRVGQFGRRATWMFNGYADQVASLYTGMDLRANF